MDKISWNSTPVKIYSTFSFFKKPFCIAVRRFETFLAKLTIQVLFTTIGAKRRTYFFWVQHGVLPEFWVGGSGVTPPPGGFFWFP